MRISERAIELPRLVLLISAVLCALGLVSIFSLPKERTPRIKLPVVVVAVPNPGATPYTNEKQIIEKVEEEVETSLDHLKDSGAVQAQAVHGAAIMQIIFDDQIDVTEAKRDVESLINRVKGQFPLEAQTDPGPIVNDIAFETFPIIQVFVSGGRDAKHRRHVAEELETQIERVSGVAGVDIFGGLEEEVQIEVDPHLMALYGFSYQQVESAIRRANRDAPSGSIESGAGQDQRVRTRGLLESVEAIARVPLGNRRGRPIVLADVAQVRMGHKPLTSMARYDGKDSVVLLARAKTDIDVLATANAIQELVDGFDAAREGVEVGTVRSQGREIDYMLRLLTSSAILGAALVVVVLWLAMGWRNAGLIAVAVPFSLLGTGALMWFAKQTFFPDIAINNMMLFGMILVVGMVVDGCIIVGENIYRHRELGRGGVEAAQHGIGEVGGSVMASYLTTFAAFVPMFLVRSVMGDFLEALPIMVLFALCSAMLVDHFLLPVLSVYLMKTPHQVGLKTRIAGDATPDAEAPSRGATGPSPEAISATPQQQEIANAEAVAKSTWIKRRYGACLEYALQHRLMVLVLAIFTSAAPVAMFTVGAIGFEFFPDADVPVIEVYFELPLGSSMQQGTVRVAQQIEQAVLRAVQPQEWYQPSEHAPRARPVTTIGEPGIFNIRIDTDHGAGPEFGMVYVELALAEDRHRTTAQIRQAIAKELPPLPGVIVRIKSPKEGPPVGAPVLVRVLSKENSSVTVEELAQRAEQVEELLRQIPGTYDVSSDYRVRPELTVTPNRTVASMFGLDANQIVTSVNYALDGVRVGEVDFGGSEQIEMRLRNSPGQRDQLEDLANLPLRNESGRVISLGQVAQVERTYGPNIVRHYDKQRVINLRAELEDGVLADDVKAALVAQLQPQLSPSHQKDLVMHQDVVASDDRTVIEFGGENEIRDEAMGDLKIAMLVAVAMMMIILTIRFNSFVQPLVVLFSVPLSLVGVTVGLTVCGFNFSIAAMIGVVALAGIVVNDAIVLVDFINRLHDAGLPMRKAAVYAGQMRLRPIMITTVTTVAGLLPLGLNLSGGGEFFQPLAVTIMFGLAFATLLQLFIIPLACTSLSLQRQAPHTPAADLGAPQAPLVVGSGASS